MDDDLDLKAFPPLNDDNYIETGDDAPQIVAVIDDRPLDMRDQAHLWRAVGDKDISSTTEKDRETEIDAGDDNVSNSLTNHQSASESCSQRVRHDSSDSDNAPTRRRSPTRRLRHDSSDSNKSLERHKEVREISSYSPPRRKARHESDSDQSPPRPMSSKYDSDQSPPRSKSTKYDSDQSPPRPKSNNYDSDQSPPRRKSHGKPLQNHARQVSDRKKTSSSDSDLSPQRNKRESSKNQIKHRDNRHSRQERDGGNPKYFSSKKEVHHLSRSGSDSPPPYPKKGMV